MTDEMKMTYKDYTNVLWLSEGDVKILKTTEKSVFVECAGITFRLRHSEIVKGAKIWRYGYREGSSYSILITVEEAKDK